MKKFLFLGIGTALMFTMGGVGPAQADGGPHRTSKVADGTINGPITTTAGRCASCHRAHTAKAEYLLKQAQPELCYSCHDGTTASTNVRQGNDGGTGALRGGGFINAQIASDAATKTMGAYDPATGRTATSGQVIPALTVGKATTSRHEIDGTSGTAWGNGTDSTNSVLGKSITLECGSCHDPHGNGNFRTLRPMPVDSQFKLVPAVADVAGTVVDESLSPVTNVNIPDQVGAVYTTANYWLSGAPGSPVNATLLTGTSGAGIDGYIQNVSAWCTTCHTRYLAATQSYKTDSGDATYMYKHRSDANYKAGAANCITCHVSHGSNAAAGGGLAPGDTAVTTDSRLLRVDNRGTCSMCHNV